MRILVTGSSGFIGRALVSRLRSEGHDVIALDSKTADMRRSGALDTHLRGWVFERIYHLAAWTQAGDFCDRRRGEQWIVNQQINTEMLRYWHERQRGAFLVAMGTSVSYAEGYELEEENYLKGIPHDRYLAYATTKRALLGGIQSLARQFGYRYLYAVPSTVYGPEYPLDGRALHFVYDIMRKVMEGLDGKKVVLWGDGHQKRELIYIDDFIDDLLTLGELALNQVVNIGAGEERTIREFAEIICQCVGYPHSDIEYDTAGFVGARSKILDIGKRNSLLGNRPRIPIDEGLRRTVKWFREARKGAC